MRSSNDTCSSPSASSANAARAPVVMGSPCTVLVPVDNNFRAMRDLEGTVQGNATHGHRSRASRTPDGSHPCTVNACVTVHTQSQATVLYLPNGDAAACAHDSRGIGAKSTSTSSDSPLLSSAAAGDASLEGEVM